MYLQQKKSRGLHFPSVFIAAAFVLLFSTTLFAQDFSENILQSATICMNATVEGDYETLLEYTYPSLVALLDNLAGGPGKGKEMIQQQLQSLQEEGVTIDSGTVGTPSAPVVAGKELMAVVPIAMYMSVNDMHFKQESYMIGVSSDGGKSWTFVNSSPDDGMMMKTLFPNWNPDLKLPEKKGPEMISMGEGEKEE